MNDQPVGSARSTPSATQLSDSPPTLWKQMLGVCIAAIVALLFYGPAGILIAATGAAVFSDAWSAGVFKNRSSRGFLNISPMAWGIVTIGLFIVAYPLYAFNRNRLKTRPGKPALFILVNVLGGLLCLLTVIRMAMRGT